jgi:hypothetical protein
MEGVFFFSQFFQDEIFNSLAGIDAFYAPEAAVETSSIMRW